MRVLVEASVKGSDEFAKVDPTISNELIKEALEDQAKLRREELKSAVIGLFSETDRHIAHNVKAIRDARKKVEKLKVKLAKIDEARAIAEKDSNFIPLMMVTGMCVNIDLSAEQIKEYVPENLRCDCAV